MSRRNGERAAPKLLLGGESLIGVSRASRDRMLQVKTRYEEPESLAVTFSKALAAGATTDQEPQQKPGDPDRRGSFKDFAGNVWSVATQR